MAKAQTAQVVITANAKVARAVLDELKRKAQDCKNQMQALADAGQQNTKSFKEAQKQFEAYNGAIAQNISNTKRVEEVMKNLANTSTRDLKRALGAAKKELEGMASTNPKLKEMQNNIARIKKQIEENTGAVKKNASAWQTAMRNITAYVSVFVLFNLIKTKITDVLRLNLKFSDQLADIRKVSGLAMKDINDLATNLSKIDTRTTVQELNAIAYAGAKLGIGKWGVGALEQFVKASNQVNVALKEDLGEDALTALSKITEVMGVIDKYGVEEAMLKTGSAIFKLGATSTATAGNIVEFTKRLAAVAQTSGVTTDQLLALGSASDSMFLMPEVSATTFIKVLSSLKTNTAAIEKAIHVEPNTLRDLLTAGKGMDAVVTALEAIKGLSATEQANAFKELGSEGARMNLVLTTMSQNVNMLKSHLRTSEEAFRQGTAITEEYNIQQETAQALMERANNLWEKAFVNPEGVDNVKKFAQAWYNLSKSMTESSTWMNALHLFFNTLILTMRVLLPMLPIILEFLLLRGVVKQWMSMYRIILDSVKVYRNLAAAIGLASKAQEKMNKVAKANVYAAIATVVVWLVSSLYDACTATEELAEESTAVQDAMDNIGKELSKVNAEVDQQRDKISGLIQKIHDQNTSERERIKLVKEVKGLWEGYNAVLDSQGKYISDNSAKLDEYIRKMRQAKVAKLADDKLAQALLDQATAKYEKQRLDDERKKVQSEAAKQRVKDEKDALSQLEADTRYNAHIGGREAKAMQGGEYLTYLRRMSEAKEREAHATDDIDEKIRQNNEAYDVANAEVEKWTKVQNEAMAVAGTIDLGDGGSGEGGEGGGGTSQTDINKVYRDKLKEAQDQAKAIIDNIKNFYERQITEVLRTANEQNWDEVLTDSAVRSVEARMNLSLSQARKAIAGISNTWDEFKVSMAEDMREQANDVGYNESALLLEQINTTNIGVLRALISQMSKNLNVPESATYDAIWKNASLNEKANETAEQKRRKAVQARLLEDNYTGKVDFEHTSSMEQLGFFDVTAEQTATLMLGGVDAEALIARRTEEISRVLGNARDHIVDLYGVNPLTEDGRNAILAILFGPSWDQDDSELKSIFDLYGDDMQAFYLELIKYSDDYTEALKRSRERQKKILDFKWGLTDKYHANDDAQKANDIQKSGVARYTKDSKTNSQPRNDIYGSARFMESMGVDPEIESYRLKMEAAQAYYNFLAAHHADAELLRNAEQAILASEIAYVKSVAEQMKQRISDVYALAKPVEDFGTAMGKAFAVMTEDAEEGKKAVKAAIAEMINGFMKQTLEMTEEYIKRRMMQQMNDRLTSMQMRRAAAEQQAIREQSAIAEANGRTLDLKNNKADRKVVKDRTNYLTKHPDEITPTSAIEGPTGEATDPLYVSIVGGMPGTPSATSGGVPTPSSGVPGSPAPAGANVPPASAGGSGVGTSIASHSGSAVGSGASQMATGDVAGGAASMAGGVVSSLGDSAIDAGTQALEKSIKKKKKLKEKDHKETVKAEKKAAKDEQKIESQKQDAIVQTTQEGGEARQLLTETVGEGIQETTAQVGQQVLATQQTQTNAEVQTTAAKTQADTAMGIASGSSNIIGSLGWWGIPLIAVITALLNGLLSFAMSKVSSLFGGGNSADTGPSTKLVSGMLTYDAGNVQAFRGAIDGNTYPVVGSDGNVYAAKDGGELSTGLVSDPITTLVNGQPALVAEKGPEMVIGRETTAAMMMARPDIIQEIVKFDKNRSGHTYRAYDAGNLSELFASMQSALPSPQSSESAEALTATLSTLATVLASIQRKGIPAHINKYGRGSVTQEAADGSRFMRNYSGDRLWRDK